MFQNKSKEIKEFQEELYEIQQKLVNFEIEINKLKLEIAKISALPSELKTQIEELILWKGKILEMAMGKTAGGKEKLNKYGKKLFTAGQPTKK